MTITSLPVMTEDSGELGQSKSEDGTVYTDATTQVKAAHWNQVRLRLIELFSEVGLTSGSTAGSLRAAVMQDLCRMVSGTTDTIVAADIGGVVGYSQAGGVEIEIPDLSGSLISGHVMSLTFQPMNDLTILTLDPGTSVTIDGGTTSVIWPDNSRACLLSFDGLAWFTGNAFG